MPEHIRFHFRRFIAVGLSGAIIILPITASAVTGTASGTRAASNKARQQINTITAFLDGSTVYGSDAKRAKTLRTMKGGLMKTSKGNLMPLNEAGLENFNDAHIKPDKELFLAGDVRSNENVELTAVHTLFLREHNRLATAIAKQNPKLTDEAIYQRARRLVIGELQAITYNEFLPALLGPNALKPYKGYKSSVNPGIANEFSAAAFRIGHTLVNDDVEFLDNDGEDVREEIPLAEAFFDPSTIKEVGPDPVWKYLATDNAQEVDNTIIGGLRNFLFGPPGAGGLDLASMNVQRGRDHGLSDYNTVRKAYGLKPVKTWSDITSNKAVQVKLKATYKNVNDIDLWVGGLAENHVKNSSAGPTFRKIIANQFERTRDGDRYWYERILSGNTLKTIKATRLSDVIKRNSKIKNVQDNVFFFTEGTSTDSTAKELEAADTKEKGGAKLGILGKLLVKFQGARSYDGWGNNLLHQDWGKANIGLLRRAKAAYTDGIAKPAGAKRPSGRAVSNAMADQGEKDLRNSRDMADWVYAWGQFIDHDLDLTLPNQNDRFDIKVPKGDKFFDPKSTGKAVILFHRSNFVGTK